MDGFGFVDPVPREKKGQAYRPQGDDSFFWGIFGQEVSEDPWVFRRKDVPPKPRLSRAVRPGPPESEYGPHPFQRQCLPP